MMKRRNKDSVGSVNMDRTKTEPSELSNRSQTLASLPRILYPSLVLLLGAVLLLGLVPACQVFSSWLTPPVALGIGIVYALIFGTTHPKYNKIGSKLLLQYSVVGLGFGMNITQALESGGQGMLFTIASVFITLALGWLIGRKLLKVSANTSTLISSGTAICGGSAIAAIAPIIHSKEEETSVALGVVFMLNAVGLFLFPVIGRALGLSQSQFGTWAAIAIHDTSSVVGAGAAFGEESLQTATTIKLTRALWIVPLTILYSFLQRSDSKRRLSIPLFIIFFLVAIILNTYVVEPYLPAVGMWISQLARKGLILSLFFIGASLSRQVITQVGPKALLQGVLLWICISIASLAFALTL